MKQKSYFSTLGDPMIKLKKMKNPKMKEKFLEGFNDGFDVGYAEARDTAVVQLAVRIERVEKLFKPDSKRFQEILDVYQGPLTEEERKRSETYIKELRGINNGNQK